MRAAECRVAGCGAAARQSLPPKGGLIIDKQSDEQQNT